MNDLQLRQLIALLWPAGDSLQGQQVYMLLDGARERSIAPLIRLGKLEFSCLFADRVSPRLRAAAPYLVHLAANSSQTRALLQRGWGNSWGVLVFAPATVTMHQLRLHFKKLLRVRTEQGRELAFRFYDPRVLRIYLPTCTDEEKSRFLGPVSRLVLESADGLTPIEFSVQLPAEGHELAPLRASEPALAPQDMAVLDGPIRLASHSGAVPPVSRDRAGQDAGAARLTATPLGMHHAQAYWELHRSGSIPALPLLPVLDSIDATRRWIRQAPDASCSIRFALRHPDHGLVGGLALSRRNDAALFGLWIGKGFQQRGYGMAALLHLRQYALQEGIRRLYVATAAERSVDAGLLRRSGFSASAQALDAPFESLRIFEWCQHDAAPASAPELLALLQLA